MLEFVPYPGAVITQSVSLVPGTYDFTKGEGLVIAADNITIEGNGAHIKGGMSQDDSSPIENRYHGTGLLIKGRSRVQVRNLAFSGFDIGIRLEDSKEIHLEHCDASDCSHDPDWGWDDHGDHGGFLILNSSHCTIEECRATNVWDAMHLRHSHNNVIKHNVFSHTSNTGLKMWRACNNRIEDNDLSWGLRISPGEVHARDSSCVLLESGSNDNVFLRNDMTHGGDGFFIRVLNGWMSTGNLMEENDCSHANNNGFEAWADHNTYIRNRANHCSYGFWLGNSNYTMMLENEAAYNGIKFHNAPEAFGNAGITFANGSCSHSVLLNNYVHDNNGPGIALRNSVETPSTHVLLSGNRIENNKTTGSFKGHGIYLKNARAIFLQDNRFFGNEGENVFLDEETHEVFGVHMPAQNDLPQPLRIDTAPGYLTAGERIALESSASMEDQVLWEFGDGTAFAGLKIDHKYEVSGFYAISATAVGCQGTRLGSLELHILPNGFIPFNMQNTHHSTGTMTQVNGIYGLPSPKIAWGPGEQRIADFQFEQVVQADPAQQLTLQLQYHGDQQPDWDKNALYPVITLHGSDGSLIITPKKPLLPSEHAPLPEQRGSGRILLIPLIEAEGFVHEKVDQGIDAGMTGLQIDCGLSDAVYSEVVINAAGFANMEDKHPPQLNLLTHNTRETLLAKPGSPSMPNPSVSRMTIPEYPNAHGVELTCEAAIDQVEAVLSLRSGNTGAVDVRNAMNRIGLEYLADHGWHKLPSSCKPDINSNRITWHMNSRIVEGICLTGMDHALFDGMDKLSAGLSKASPLTITGDKQRALKGITAEVKLNIELSADGTPLPDLTASVHALNEQLEPGEVLSTTAVPSASIIPYRPLSIDFPQLTLQEGSPYALVLGQARLAKTRESGGYYRWICQKIEGQMSLAILSDTGAKPMAHDWGTGWLKISSQGAKTRLNHTSSHVGVRFGYSDTPQAYQVFNAPTLVSKMTDCMLAGVDYQACNETLQIKSQSAINGLYLYLGECIPESIEIHDGFNSYYQFANLKNGVNYLALDVLWEANKVLLLTVKGSAAITEIIAV